jgi:hypothetical protein
MLVLRLITERDSTRLERCRVFIRRVLRPSVVDTHETLIWVPRSSRLLARAGQLIDERLR